MIKEKFIGMLVSIFILLLACSEQNDNETIVNNAIMGKDKVNISLSLSSLPEVQIEGHTDYRPMSSRATGNVRSIISNSYKCLVIKEIGNKYLTTGTLSGVGSVESSKWEMESQSNPRSNSQGRSRYGSACLYIQFSNR